MFKPILVTVMVLGSSAFASKPKLRCEVEAYKIKAADSFLTSKIAEKLDAEAVPSRPETMTLGTTIAYGQEKNVYVFVSLDTKTGEVDAELRPNSTPAMAGVFGAGVGKFKGNIQLVDQTFSVSTVLKGEIEEGFLNDREDKNLVDFDSLTLTCQLRM